MKGYRRGQSTSGDGSSTGYGLASRIVSAFGAGAASVGVCFERPASGKRTATAGWYDTGRL